MSTKNPKTDDVWDAEEEKVFAAFGVSKGDLPLRRFIRGQRRINAKLYVALDLVVAFLKSSGTVADDNLKKAEEINDLVPGDPPGCDKTGLGVPGD